MNENTEKELFNGASEKDFQTILTGIASLDILDGAKGDDARLSLGNRKTRRAMRKRLKKEGYHKRRDELRALKKR